MATGPVTLEHVAQAAGVSGQGTWETTLQARDINHDGTVDAYYDSELHITWLTDANFTVGKVLAVHLPTMEFSFNEVLRVAGCPGCGPSSERDDHELYFEMASFGVVKVLDGQSGSGVRRYPDMPWEPKAAFNALADCYGP